jgi:hypothetical protein
MAFFIFTFNLAGSHFIMTHTIQQHFKSWIPFKVLLEKDELLFRWLYTGVMPYTHPFFDETLVKCQRYAENTGRYRGFSDAAMLEEWSKQIEHVAPTAFIFHVSRCGSTLVSQALGMREDHISLSEVPMFDEILRLRFKDVRYDQKATGDLLKAAIRFYGAKRTGLEQKLFIKADSWHLCFYAELRGLYPDTPFIILYRSPAEVLHSNQLKKGIQTVYGLVEPQLLGLENISDEQTHPDIYMALVLEKFYHAIINAHHTDNKTLLLNYDQGLVNMMQETAAFTGMDISAAYMAAIEERGNYNAKYPKEAFAERAIDSTTDAATLQALRKCYNDIDALRMGVTV